jgi:RecA-family ATPase
MVEPQLALTMNSGFLHMHVQAERTSVHLGCADVHEIEERRTQRSVRALLAHFKKDFDQLRGMLVVVDSHVHFFLSEMKTNHAKQT